MGDLSVEANGKPPIKLESAREIIRLSEIFLDGTIRLSLASDGRSMQLSSISATASIGIILFGIDTISSEAPFRIMFAAAAFSAASMFFLVTIFSLTAARPRPVNIVGTTRSQWSDAELRGSLADALIEQADIYTIQIDENLVMLRKNALRIRAALYLLGATPAVATVVALIAYCLAV